MTALPSGTTPLSRTSTLALISLITGIFGLISLPVALFFFPLLCVTLVLAIAAVVTGHLALPQISSSSGRVTGRGLAVVGLVLGYGLLFLVIVLPICSAIVLAVLALLGPAIGDVFSNIVVNI